MGFPGLYIGLPGGMGLTDWLVTNMNLSKPSLHVLINNKNFTDVIKYPISLTFHIH